MSSKNNATVNKTKIKRTLAEAAFDPKDSVLQFIVDPQLDTRYYPVRIAEELHKSDPDLVLITRLTTIWRIRNEAESVRTSGSDVSPRE